MSTQKHSPLPLLISERNDRIIVSVENPNLSLLGIDANDAVIVWSKEDARFWVDCVNSHAHLVESNRRLIEACEQVLNADELKQISFETVQSALTFAKIQPIEKEAK